MPQSELTDYQNTDCIDYTDPDELRKAYWDDGMTIQEIADNSTVSAGTVYRWMEKLEIDRRGMSPDNSDSEIDYTDPDVLREYYHDKEMSTTEIAELADCTSTTIADHMEKHDIERRERVSAARWASRNEWLHRYLDSQGYINYEDTWSDNRTIGIHRLLAISEFGIEAVKDKVVHHKNRIPWDNRPDNIEIMTTEEHSCHHQEQGHLGPK